MAKMLDCLRKLVCGEVTAPPVAWRFCHGIAYASTLELDESFVTLVLKINYLRPVWAGKLLATPYPLLSRISATHGGRICSATRQEQ